jgi:hypothetical protein
VLALLACVCQISYARADSPDAKFLAGLRERQLFELAERYCGDRLKTGQLTPRLEAELTAERMRTLALHAANVPPQEREALWQAARQQAAEFLRAHPQHPRAILVRVQDALTLLAQGELGRQEYQAGALAETALEPVRQALRQAADLLADLDKELTTEIPQRRRVEPRGDELTADELFSLQQHIEHQLARSYRNQALLYEPKSENRIALLLKAVETLNKPLPLVPPEDPLAAHIQLDLAVCQRLLGNLADAGQLLTALDQESQPAKIRSHARAELLRLLVDAQNYPAAQAMVERGPGAKGAAGAEFQLAALETYLALWRNAAAAKDEAASKAWQQKAADGAKLLEATFGAYWGRRADQLLIHSLPQGGGAANVELLSRTADQLYLKQEFEPAIAAYDKAAEQARTAGDTKAMFELLYKAALVEQKRGRHAAAAERFRAVAVGLKLHPLASEAHLLAAWNAQQLARSDAQAEAQYVALLAEQIELWPTSESAAQARLWLGQLHVAKEQWMEAVRAYRDVPRASQHYPAAMAALADCYGKALEAEQAAGQNVEASATAAVKFFQQVILGPENRLPERWTDTERLAALAAAEIVLDYLPTRQADAEGVLTTALNASADAPEAWKSAAQARLVVCLAAQPTRQAEAQKLLAGIAAASPQKLLEMLASLAEVSQRARPAARPAIAALQLQAADMLASHATNLDKDSQLTLARLRAAALASAGKRDEALAAYTRLVAANPNVGSIQQGYAELLLAGSDRQSLSQALDRWRLIASRTRPRTPQWERAKYSVALAQFKLGDKAAAAQLVRYQLETPPGVEGEWKPRFEALLKQCEQ